MYHYMKRDSAIHHAQLRYCKFPFVLRKSLSGADGLGNPDLDFPMGIVYGDKDVFSSDRDPEAIIKGSKQYSSGRSQLFKVPNCTHCIPQDRPDALCNIMVGFFEGTITGTFEPTPMDEYPSRCK